MSLSPFFAHANPGTVQCGPGCIKNLPRALAGTSKPLIVTDQGLVKAGILDKIGKVLGDNGISFAVYDATPPDPPVESVEEAGELYKSQGCDAVLALGGGSPMDAAKGVIVRVSQEGDFLEYTKGKAYENPMPLLVAVPTTAGTGSEVTTVAVISDTQAKIKRLLLGAQLVPKVAILDPKLLAGLPSHIAAETGADALTHAIEGLVTLGAQPVSEALCLQAVRLVSRWLRPMVANPGDTEAAGHMLLASCLASMGWTNAGLGLAHSLAHPLGAHYHVSHGKACAMYLPHVMRFNLLAKPEQFTDIAAALGEDTYGIPSQQACHLAPEAVEMLFEEIGLPMSYDEIGLDFELKTEMVDEVLSVRTHKSNPRRSNREQVEELFNAPAE
jgi:alcohol dehydrogenase